MYNFNRQVINIWIKILSNQIKGKKYIFFAFLGWHGRLTTDWCPQPAAAEPRWADGFVYGCAEDCSALRGMSDVSKLKFINFDKSILFVQSYHLHSKNKLETRNPYSSRNPSAGPRSPILSWIAVWARSITPTTLTSMWMASPIPQRPTTIASVWVSCPTSTGILPSRIPEGTLERVSPLKIPLLCRTGFSLVVRSSMLWTLISVSDWHAYDRHQKPALPGGFF